MLTRHLAFNNKELVVIKCKYCRKRFKEINFSGVPTTNLMNKYKQHVLMKHPNRFAGI